MDNGWDEYKKLILSELQDNKDFRKEVRDVLTNLRTDIGGLKVKAAMAGGIAGIVGTGAVTVLVSLWK